MESCDWLTPTVAVHMCLRPCLHRVISALIPLAHRNCIDFSSAHSWRNLHVTGKKVHRLVDSFKRSALKSPWCQQGLNIVEHGSIASSYRQMIAPGHRFLPQEYGEFAAGPASLK